MPTFPPGLEPIEDLSPSLWVQEALKDWPAGPFLVRDLVPPVFEAYARILHRPNRPTDGRIPTGTWAERASEGGHELGPKTGRDVLKGPKDEGRGDDWRAEEGSLIELEAEALGSLLSGHTSTPLDCWFAMWSGWGDLSEASSGALYRVPEGTIADLRTRWRSRLESWRARREASRLKTFPLLGRSGRSYLLFHGAVDDAARFDLGHRFQSPALWWPQDRSWFVHTEIDGTSTYVGGSRSLIGRLVGEQILESFEVDAEDPALL
jgi:hypothetical protein